MQRRPASVQRLSGKAGVHRPCVFPRLKRYGFDTDAPGLPPGESLVLGVWWDGVSDDVVWAFNHNIANIGTVTDWFNLALQDTDRTWDDAGDIKPVLYYPAAVTNLTDGHAYWPMPGVTEDNAIVLTYGRVGEPRDQEWIYKTGCEFFVVNGPVPIANLTPPLNPNQTNAIEPA